VKYLTYKEVKEMGFTNDSCVVDRLLHDVDDSLGLYVYDVCGRTTIRRLILGDDPASFSGKLLGCLSVEDTKKALGV